MRRNKNDFIKKNNIFLKKMENLKIRKIQKRENEERKIFEAWKIEFDISSLKKIRI